MKRTISLVLLLSMAFLMCANIVYASEIDNTSFKEHTICVFSNVIGVSNIAVYEDSQNHFYMKADDICKLTRSTISKQGHKLFQKENDTLNIKHGIRSIMLSASRGELTEQQYNIQHEINMHLHNGVFLIEAEPLLQYLGAQLEVERKSANIIFLNCKMPPITLWEALDNDIPNVLDTNHYYGGETNIKIRMSCDIISDMIFGHGFFVSPDDYIKDAYYEILNYTFDESDTILEKIAKRNDQNYKITSDYIEFLKNDIDVAKNVVEARSEPWKIMKEITYTTDTSAKVNLKKATTYAYYQSEIEEALKNNDNIGELYDKYFGKPLSQMEKVSLLLKMASFTANFMNTYSSMYKVSAEKTELMKDVLSNEKLDHYGINSDRSYYIVANDILNDLSESKARQVADTLVDTSAEFFTKEAAEQIIEKFVGGSVSQLKGVVDVSIFLTYLIEHEKIKAFSDDLKGMFLSDIQRVVFNNSCAISKRMISEKCNKIETLEDYRSALSYYCLSTLCMYQKLRDGSAGLAISDRQKNKIYNAFDPEIKKLTEIYFDIKVCEVSPIIDFDELVCHYFNDLLAGDLVIEDRTLDVDMLPKGKVEFNGHYYYIYNLDEIVSGTDAAAYCEKQGGYMATITSPEENEFLFNYMKSLGYESVYFGFTDSVEEGQWKWLNGEDVSYVNWHDSEPNEENPLEDYAMFYYQYDDGTWNDGDFGGNTVNGGTAFICEWGDYKTSSEPKVEDIKSNSGERDIILTLDLSSSMSGKSIMETKNASTKFIDNILNEDANIGLVGYSNSATILSDLSANKDRLKEIVSSLKVYGRTNMEGGLSTAYAMLKNSNARKKIIVLMSDGEPNEGKEGDELVAYADEIKSTGIIIYTVGFFESMSGGKSSAQILMERIASEGYHYEVASADELVYFFDDVANQINGQRYIYVRIACPVDVSVTYNGETLDSSSDNLNTRTDFGTLSFEENYKKNSRSNKSQTKILRLKEGVDYNIKIVGTGRGLMNYTMGLMDESGSYTDFRTFENVKIDKGTIIDTVASASKETVLKIDQDGNKKYDVVYKASKNQAGVEQKIGGFSSNILVIAIVGMALVIVLFVVVKVRKKAKRKEKK